jgi:hypothetical protein
VEQQTGIREEKMRVPIFSQTTKGRYHITWIFLSDTAPESALSGDTENYRKHDHPPSVWIS